MPAISPAARQLRPAPCRPGVHAGCRRRAGRHTAADPSDPDRTEARQARIRVAGPDGRRAAASSRPARRHATDATDRCRCAARPAAARRVERRQRFAADRPDRAVGSAGAGRPRHFTDWPHPARRSPTAPAAPCRRRHGDRLGAGRLFSRLLMRWWRCPASWPNRPPVRLLGERGRRSAVGRRWAPPPWSVGRWRSPRIAYRSRALLVHLLVHGRNLMTIPSYTQLWISRDSYRFHCRQTPGDRGRGRS